jgi:NADH-ubiquinone oxidoreductase chain 2
MQYSISNLNAFIILISIGFSLYYYINNSEEYKQLPDKNNSPIQLISQLKGYFYVNPYLALSLAITIFSFAGIPPLLGFFAKQMVLSAALDSGYIFITLVAILTSVVSGVYYLNIVKELFFSKTDYKINPELEKIVLHGNIITSNTMEKREEVAFTLKNIVLSSSLTITISILTLIILLFMFIPTE